MPTQVAQGAQQQPQKFLRAPLSIDAFPISIDAFPISIDAFPVSIAAIPICQGAPTTASAGCHAQYRTDIASNPNPNTAASQLLGYAPADLQNAYGATQAAATAGGSQTVAIVVAYQQSTLESDLAVYRAAYGLPPCTSQSGCLTFISGGGAAPGPAGPGPSSNPWAAEAALDVEMISAMCPNCEILVSQANSSSIPDLANAVDAAVSAGATVVSNSYSVPEAADNAAYESHYNHPGVPITAGAGDQGYGVGFPASSPHVTAVGGTSLVRTSGSTSGSTLLTGPGPAPAPGTVASTWGEAVWPGTGSGCSAFFKKPKWQTDAGCKNRTLNDVAVVADPATGVAGYSVAAGGWNVFGGTSVGAPIVAALYALAGNGATIKDASHLYAHPNAFAAVLLRANGTCTPTYLCTASPGYDGPTGLGVPGSLAPF
jgi:subtilase family serine protease